MSAISNNDKHNITLKRELIEATDSVRQKFNSIKKNKIGDRADLEKFYEPVTKPLKQFIEVNDNASFPKIKSMLNTNTSTPMKHVTQKIPGVKVKSMISSFETLPEDDTSSTNDITTSTNNNELHEIETIAKFHIDKLMSGDESYDKIYGVRSDKNKLFMGRYEIRFHDNKVSLWSGNKNRGEFNGSPELYDLLFLKKPYIHNNGVLDSNLRKTYESILNLTKIAYNDYNIRNGLNITNTEKFRLIKNISSPSPTHLRKLPNITYGKGVKKKTPSHKIFDNKPSKYVYWNTTKELVDRLRLLWSSKIAGHNGHDNEILSICEELREEGIIY